MLDHGKVAELHRVAAPALEQRRADPLPSKREEEIRCPKSSQFDSWHSTPHSPPSPERGWVGPTTRNLALRRPTVVVMSNSGARRHPPLQVDSRPLPIDDEGPGLFAELLTVPVHTLNPDRHRNQQTLAAPTLHFSQ